jgi:hypothetical protein
MEHPETGISHACLGEQACLCKKKGTAALPEIVSRLDSNTAEAQLAKTPATLVFVQSFVPFEFQVWVFSSDRLP